MIAAPRALLVAALLLAGCATGTRESAYVAHGADLASTGAALAQGAIELNPLGVALIPAKVITTEYIGTLPEDQQPAAYDLMSSVMWGATANNLCVAAGMATGGALMPLCIAIGLATGITYHEHAEKERGRQWLIAWCAEWVKQGPEYTCDMGDS